MPKKLISTRKQGIGREAERRWDSKAVVRHYYRYPERIQQQFLISAREKAGRLMRLHQLQPAACSNTDKDVL